MAKGQKKRGKFLTVMLVVIGLLIISNIAGIVFGGNRYLNSEGKPSWINYITITLNIIEVVSFIGILYWKKIAAWIYLPVIIIAVFIAQVYGIVPPQLDKNAIYLLWIAPTIIYGLLYWAISRQWKYFE